MRYYELRHFKAWELLPPEIHQDRGAAGLIVFDARILWTIDAVRDYFGKAVTVNNWHEGGKLSQRGFRTDPAVGTYLSPHRFGRAVDFDIDGVTPGEFRALVRAGKLARELQYATRIEDGVDWNHVDCVAVPGTEIVFFKQ